MMLLRILLIVLGFTCVVLVDGKRQTKGRNSNSADSDESVPPLSVFIPPLQLFSIMSSNDSKSGNDTESRSHLILEPLLAMLNEEEVQMLTSIFPNLFSQGNIIDLGEKDQLIGRRSTKNESTSETTTQSPMGILTMSPLVESESEDQVKSNGGTEDPLLSWLFKGRSEPESSTPPAFRPLVGVTDDMLMIMLSKLMQNITTSTPSTTTVLPEFAGPVGIGDDLLSMLLKTLHTKAQETTTPAFDDSIIFNLTRPTTTTSTTTEGPYFTTDEPFEFLSPTVSSSSKTIWPERVKPGGGISDEALMQIIQDVKNITRNSSRESVGASGTTARASEIDADAVAQIIHDVKALQATTSELNYLLSTTDGRVLDAIETPKNKTKTSNNKKKKPGRGGKGSNTKNKGSTSKGGTKNNSTRKAKRQRNRTTTRRPSLWERIVRAAANAFFGETQTKPGLFQAEDIIDLISSLK